MGDGMSKEKTENPFQEALKKIYDLIAEAISKMVLEFFESPEYKKWGDTEKAINEFFKRKKEEAKK